MVHLVRIPSLRLGGNARASVSHHAVMRSNRLHHLPFRNDPCLCRLFGTGTNRKSEAKKVSGTESGARQRGRKISMIVAGHTAFAIIALSYLVGDILYLRVLSCVASCMGGLVFVAGLTAGFSMTYSYHVAPKPLWLVINWNLVFLIVNLLHIITLLRSVVLSTSLILITVSDRRCH